MSSQVALADGTIEQLRAAVGGEVITPGDADYEEARRVWNGMIDCHPALIVRCASTDDVAAAVNFGRDHDLLVSVRGGSHSTPGYSTCDDGIVIDLGPMNRVTVDPDSRTARVQGGATWGDMDAATQEHGLAADRGPRVRHRCGGPGARQRQRLARADVRSHVREHAVGRGRDGRREGRQGQR